MNEMCIDPVVFGHLDPHCPATSDPPGAPAIYRPYAICGADCHVQHSRPDWLGRNLETAR